MPKQNKYSALFCSVLPRKVWLKVTTGPAVLKNETAIKRENG